MRDTSAHSVNFLCSWIQYTKKFVLATTIVGMFEGKTKRGLPGFVEKTRSFPRTVLIIF